MFVYYSTNVPKFTCSRVCRASYFELGKCSCQLKLIFFFCVTIKAMSLNLRF